MGVCEELGLDGLDGGSQNFPGAKLGALCLGPRFGRQVLLYRRRRCCV